MFLSFLGKEAEQPQKPAEPSLTAPVAPPAAWQPEPGFAPSRQAPPAASQGGPGEFTKLFQASQAAAATTPPADRTPVPSFEPRPVPAPAGASAPGEFTRIFVKAGRNEFARSRAPRRKTNSRSSPPLPRRQARRGMKGFSSGASDSASVEGGFTQFFSRALLVRPPASARVCASGATVHAACACPGCGAGRIQVAGPVGFRREQDPGRIPDGFIERDQPLCFAGGGRDWPGAGEGDADGGRLIRTRRNRRLPTLPLRRLHSLPLRFRRIRPRRLPRPPHPKR